MNNNKPKPTPAKKKSTPPTKPLTPAKKARGGKKRPALSRFTKKVSKEAKAHKKNPPTRAMLEGFVKDALRGGRVLLDGLIVANVRGRCLGDDLASPDSDAIKDLLALMFSHGQLVRVGSDRYKLPEKKAQGGHVALRHPTKTPRRRKNAVERVILDVLKTFGPLSMDDLKTEVGKHKHYKDKKKPLPEAIELRTDMLSEAGLVAIMGAKEEEAPPTTPSGKHEVITADSVKEKEDQAVQEDRAWAGKVQKVILDMLLSSRGPVFSSKLFDELVQDCKEANVATPGVRRFDQIVRDMIDSGEVLEVGGRRALGSTKIELLLNPGPNAKAEPAPPLGSKMPNRLRRTIDRERSIMRARAPKDESDQEHLAAVRLRTLQGLTTDQVLAALTPVSDALGDLLAFPNEWPQEATLSLDFVLPSGLETFFDGIFGEKTIYTLKLTLIRPVIVGRIAEDVLIACQSDSPLGCAQHFLAHVERFVHYGAHNAPGKRPKHLTDALVELKADVLGACAVASKVLQGAVLDNALRFFR